MPLCSFSTSKHLHIPIVKSITSYIFICFWDEKIWICKEIIFEMYEKQLDQMYMLFLYVAFVNTLKFYSRSAEKKTCRTETKQYFIYLK